ncbi:hypothetical protein ACKW6Q_03215 [Chryseobacterium kwangjuense]|uniref:Uncharacterized protein n=1 Tax=Chryseobacterium kwangjuense TaxID=267125 RepID=A0ABW9K029_9FLAO
MNPLQQQPKPITPLFQRASLLLWLFLSASAFYAQSFYLMKGTTVTIDETTTFFVKNSGTVSQIRIRNFEAQIPGKESSSNQTKRTVLRHKKFKFSSKKKEERRVSISSEKKHETVQKPKTGFTELKPCPDHFISSYQQGMAISASVPTLQCSPKFLIQSTIPNIIQGYSSYTNHELTDSSFLFLNNYYLLQHTTRPPPFTSYLKETYSNC